MDAESSVKSVLRAADILRALGAGAAEGRRLSDIAEESGLGKTTTHRLLSALVEAGFAWQDPADRRYHLGEDLIRLGRAATRVDVAALAQPGMLRLAHETGDAVFLSVREGLEAICLDRHVGDYPIKTLTLDQGDRRPLGVGAGALVLLAFLPDDEIDEILRANAERLAEYPGFAPDKLRELIARAREAGHSRNDGRIVSAMAAVGVPVFGPEGRVAAALSLAAIKDRMTPERIAWLTSLLRREAHRLEARLADPAGRAGTPDQKGAA